MFNVFTVGHVAYINPIVKLLPNAFQHCVVDGCKLQRLLLFGPSVQPRCLEEEVHRPVLSRNPRKEIVGCKIWKSGIPGHENGLIKCPRLKF